MLVGVEGMWIQVGRVMGHRGDDVSRAPIAVRCCPWHLRTYRLVWDRALDGGRWLLMNGWMGLGLPL